MIATLAPAVSRSSTYTGTATVNPAAALAVRATTPPPGDCIYCGQPVSNYQPTYILRVLNADGTLGTCLCDVGGHDYHEITAGHNDACGYTPAAA